MPRFSLLSSHTLLSFLFADALSIVSKISSRSEVEEYLKRFDKNGDGKITFIEFLQGSGYELK